MIRLLVALALAIPLGLDLYLPVPDDNPLTTDKIDLGRRLFSDRRLSRDGSTACVTCHDPARAFSDGRMLAVGIAGRVGRRHAPALINRGYGRAFFWDARIATLEEQVLKPIEDPNEMDLPVEEAAARVGVDRMTLSQALASYVRSILSGDAPYDRFVNGDQTALSPDQRTGLQVFRGKGNCTACHVGPTFSDERLHNTGVAWAGGAGAAGGAGRSGGARPAGTDYLDEGRATITGEPEDRGAFKTPTLREITRTAPYMHDGSFASLDRVLEFYSDGGRPNPHLDTEIRPLHLTVPEQQAVIAFLGALSGTVQQGVTER
jgi:cytochrome c peroxidase